MTNCIFCGQPQQGQGAKKPVNGKKIGIIAGIAVALVLAIVFVIKFTGPGAPTQKAALKSYIKAVLDQDVDALIDAYLPKKLWDGIKKEYGNDDIKDGMEYLLSWCDDIDDVRKIKITDKDKANRSEIKDFEDNIKDELNVKIKISGLVRVKFKYEAKKDGEWEESIGTLTLYKTGGKWFVMGVL